MPQSPINPNFVFAPVFDFYMRQNEFEFSRYLKVSRFDFALSAQLTTETLAEYEQDEIRTSLFCFIVNEEKPNDITYSEIINTLLLAFWIYSPTKVHVRFKFGPGIDFSKFLDQFQFNRMDHSQGMYSAQDLGEIKEIFSRLVRVRRRRGRLSHVYFFTFYGCLTIHSLVAYTLYSSAIEAILTHSSGPGITRRLAKSFACFLETQPRKRNALFKRFKRIYEIRSDIMHGGRKRFRGDTNLKNLKLITDALRILWKRVLSDDHSRIELEKADSFRQAFFKQVELGYTPPP